MITTPIHLTKERSPGLETLRRSGAAFYGNAAKVELSECTLRDECAYVTAGGLERKLAGRTVRGQTVRALENLQHVFEHACDMMNDLGGFRIQTTTMNLGYVEVKHDVRRECFVEGHYPGSTLASVSQLVRDGAAIEIDANAVVPKSDL